MIKNYLITAWRNLRRNKVYTFINVLGLALGICACLIIYLITSFELGYDTFHPDKERIYRIVSELHFKEGGSNTIAASVSRLPASVRDEIHGLNTVTGFYNYFAKTTVPPGISPARKFEAPKEGDQPSPVIIAEPRYFNIFQYQWLQGNPQTALNEPFKVVLSEQEAYKYFGSIPLEDVIGKELIYNDSLRVNVSGIVKDWGKNTDFGFKDFISFATIQNSFMKKDFDFYNWGMWEFNSQAFVKLDKNVNRAQIEKQLAAFAKEHLPKDLKVGLTLQPLSDIHFNANYQDSYSRQAHLPTLYALIAIAAFILIIAAINFINLSTAQSLRRAKEVGVRKVLGSNRASLTIQFLAETLIVTIIAVLIAVLFTNPIIATFSSIIPKGVVLNIYDPTVIAFLVSIILLTTLLAGFYPARVLSSYLPVLSLKGQASHTLNHKSICAKALSCFNLLCRWYLLLVRL